MATWNTTSRAIDRLEAATKTMQSRSAQAGEADERGDNVAVAAHLLATMRHAAKLSDLAVAAVQEVVELAAAKTELTQKQMEEALGVPKGTLRGLRRGARV